MRNPSAARKPAVLFIGKMLNKTPKPFWGSFSITGLLSVQPNVQISGTIGPRCLHSWWQICAAWVFACHLHNLNQVGMQHSRVPRERSKVMPKAVPSGEKRDEQVLRPCL